MVNTRLVPSRPFLAKSHDDLPAVARIDSVEERLRITARLLDEELARAERAEFELKQLQGRATKELTSNPPHNPISINLLKGVTVYWKNWKLVVPLSILFGIAPLIWALVNDYLEVHRQLDKLKNSYDATERRVEEVDHYAHELKENMAQISGYLAGVLPKTGRDPGITPNVVSNQPSIEELRVSKPVHTTVKGKGPQTDF